MNFRLFRRVNAVIFVCCLALAPSVLFAAPRQREMPLTPRERIVRIIKQIRNFFTPSTMEDGVTPPRPTGP
jgi:hypothetical protein